MKIDKILHKLGWVRRKKYERQKRFIARANDDLRKKLIDSYNTNWSKLKPYNAIIVQLKENDLFGGPIIFQRLNPRFKLGDRLKYKFIKE